MAETKDSAEERSDGIRHRLLLAAAIAAAVVLIAGLVALYFAFGQQDAGDDPGLPSPSASGTPSPSASPSPSDDAAPDASGDALPEGEGPEEVPVGEEAELGAGLSASVTDVVSFTAEGRGVGETSGPALRFVLEVNNASGEPVSLDGASVNLYYGGDATPASPLLNDESAAPLAGELAPAATARGTYAFSVPENQHESFRLEFSHAAGSARVIFRP